MKSNEKKLTGWQMMAMAMAMAMAMVMVMACEPVRYQEALWTAA